MLFFSRENVRERHGLAAGSAAELAVDAQYYKMARRHRISLVGDYSFGEMNAIKPFLTGSYYTAAHGYAGPGAGSGSDVFPIAVYNSDRNVFGATPAAWCRRAGEWAGWFRANSPDTEAFLYLWDEPAPDSDVWPWVSRRTTWLAHCAGPGKALKTFITSEPLSTLLAKGGYVSIWAATPSEIQPDDVHYVRKHGWELWLYNGEHPYSGSWLSDDYGVGPRTLPWIAFKYGIATWFFWESTYWYNFQGGEKEIDVYQQASNFSDNRGQRANGDGLLFYPGQDRVFPHEDHGVRGPIPSIRLDSFRRGLQDYEYLVLARRLGLGRQVSAIVARVIPAALWDAQGRDSPSWSIHGDDWDAARLRLATLIYRARA
jgi:Domain of unknown function (DUF4091)